MKENFATDGVGLNPLHATLYEPHTPSYEVIVCKPILFLAFTCQYDDRFRDTSRTCCVNQSAMNAVDVEPSHKIAFMAVILGPSTFSSLNLL